MGGVGRFFRNLRFKYKLIFSYVVLIIIPLLSFGLYSFDQAQKDLLRQVQITLNDNVQKAADDINNKFKKYNTIIDSVSYNTKIADIFNTPYSGLFLLYQQLTDIYDPLTSDLKTYNSDILQIVVYTDNNLPERANSIRSLERLRQASWLPEVIRSGQTRWMLEEQRLFGIKRMMIGPNNKLQNLLYVEVDPGVAFAVPQQGESRQHAVIVTDSDGAPIYTRNETDIDISAFERETADAGNRRLTIRKIIPEPGWTITYYYPLDSLTMRTGQVVGTVAAIAGLCLLILLVLIWLFSNTLVRRIEYLNKKINQIARGDLQVAMMEDRSRDEIGGLTRGVTQMLGSINRLIREVRESTDTQKKAELKALQAQINPHFLYNSLSLINWKAIKMKATDISLITTSLSKFYRTTLNKGRSVIPIREEIENIRAYLDIQLIMHDHSFDLEFEIDDNLPDLFMVNLILQPIVENAIEHGIDHKKNGRGLLRVTGRLSGDTVEFRIADNGSGMAESEVSRILAEDTEGYGLKNVQSRLQLWYGEPYGIEVNSMAGRGTEVIVRFAPSVPADRSPI